LATYNTQYDAANTAVRAFLTRVGEYYLGKTFNTSGKGNAKSDWLRIRDKVFKSECAYCGKKSETLQMDHLIMINRTQYGLHHPGNIVPACSKCNKRSKNNIKEYNNWEDHLLYICEREGQKDIFAERWKRIRSHITEGEFAYPKLSSEEQNAIQIIAENLYSGIKSEFDKSLKLYKRLDETFSQNS